MTTQPQITAADRKCFDDAIGIPVSLGWPIMREAAAAVIAAHRVASNAEANKRIAELESSLARKMEVIRIREEQVAAAVARAEELRQDLLKYAAGRADAIERAERWKRVADDLSHSFRHASSVYEALTKYDALAASEQQEGK